LIKIAKEPIVNYGDEAPALAADRLKNAAATKKLAIFDALDILARIDAEEEILNSEQDGPSKTDSTVAPSGHENLFILIPVAPGLADTEEIRAKYFKAVAERIKAKTEFDVNENLVYFKSYAPSNFVKDYNAFKGNAYGLANTLMQTAHLKPSLKSKKVKNLFYTGQLTVPGPGVPPSLISGKLASEQVLNFF
jgi:phytoene dehydrogenase-like protein